MYINQKVANHLDLQGKPGKLRVKVLEGQFATLDRLVVEVVLESASGQLQKEITAYTTRNFAGDMEVINCEEEKKQWPHLQKINFP